MELSLPSEVLKGLPEPDDNGLVRVTVALRLSREKAGKASVVEINDVPVSGKKTDEEELEDATSNMPGPYDVASQMLRG